MPGNCAVATCKFAHGKVPGQEGTFSSFRFPKSPEIRSIWIHHCGRADSFDPEKSRICGLHFSESDISPTSPEKVYDAWRETPAYSEVVRCHITAPAYDHSGGKSGCKVGALLLYEKCNLSPSWSSGYGARLRLVTQWQ